MQTTATLNLLLPFVSSHEMHSLNINQNTVCPADIQNATLVASISIIAMKIDVTHYDQPSLSTKLHFQTKPLLQINM